MLSMSRVLVESPRVLVADELSLGLAPIVVDEVYETLEMIRDRGTALLIVEQHVDHALDLCERVVILDHGAIAWEGGSSQATDVVVTQNFDRFESRLFGRFGFSGFRGDGGEECPVGAVGVEQ